jgi:hypothetical protein
MPATYPARTAVRGGNYVLELKDLSPMPHPNDNDTLATIWDYKVAVGPNTGKPVQLVVPATRQDHAQMVKQHFAKGYAKDGGDTHRRALVGRRVVADIAGNLVTISRYESDLDAPSLNPAEVARGGA